MFESCGVPENLPLVLQLAMVDIVAKFFFFFNTYNFYFHAVFYQ